MPHRDVTTLPAMVRIEIRLTEEQARRFRAWASEHGVSLAEAIRQCVDRVLSDEASSDLDSRFARAAELIGSLTDPQGATDLSSDHDRYLDRAFE